LRGIQISSQSTGFEDLQETVPDALVAVDRAGLIRFAKSPDRVTVRLRSRRHGGHAPANKIYQLVFAEGMALNYPLTIRHRNGTATEVPYNASVYRDANGKVSASSPPPAR
jgi:hypothetical protein